MPITVEVVRMATNSIQATIPENCPECGSDLSHDHAINEFIYIAEEQTCKYDKEEERLDYDDTSIKSFPEAQYSMGFKCSECGRILAEGDEGKLDTIHQETLEEILNQYLAIISVRIRRISRDADKTVEPIKADHRLYMPEPQTIDGHISWMISELKKGEMKDSKALRWLCFIQGVLWATGRTSIESARQDNYRLLNGGEKPPPGF